MFLYLQLAGQLKEKIISGELPAGSKLPSYRQLAKELKVSRNTVESAYQQLRQEGYLESKPCSGFYVAQAIEGQASLINFQYGKINHQHCPFDLWSQLTNQCLRMEQKAIGSANNPQGELDLRNHIMKYLAKYRGISCSAEQIILGAGNQHCLSLLCQLLPQQLSSIAMEDPGAEGTRAVFRNHGKQIIPVSLGKEGINVEELANTSAQVVYVTPYTQFPSGQIMSVARKLELLEWAESRRGLIIEEDYYSDFQLCQGPSPALPGLSKEDNVIYLGTFSRAMNLRISYLVLPKTILEQYGRSFREYDSTISALQQKTLELFMDLGYWEQHLKQIGEVYRQKYSFLLEQITEQMKDHVLIHGSKAGLHLLLEINNGLQEEELIRRAEGKGVQVYPVAKHWLRKEKYPQNMVLLGSSGIKEKDIYEGVKRLKKAWF